MTTEPTPETARSLLWRHGLPEDVIDGALALHAQELAGKIRAYRDHTRGAVQATKVMDFAASLIDPTAEAPTTTKPEPDGEPYAGDERPCLACNHSMDSHIRINGEIDCVFQDCTDPTPAEAQP